MGKLYIDEYMKKVNPILEESLRHMREHPVSLEEAREQVRRNNEIRKQNELQREKLKKTQAKGKDKEE